jgi:hypothetical protein
LWKRSQAENTISAPPSGVVLRAHGCAGMRRY